MKRLSGKTSVRLIGITIFLAFISISGEPVVEGPTVPNVPAPTESPGPIPEVTPPESAPGQWVYTTQYGWLWMPYGQNYVYFPVYGDPCMFVYYPVAGWTWIVAPWLWGWGPVPYFGPSGGSRFGWYGQGWGRSWRGSRDHRSPGFASRFRGEFDRPGRRR